MAPLNTFSVLALAFATTLASLDTPLSGKNLAGHPLIQHGHAHAHASLHGIPSGIGRSGEVLSQVDELPKLNDRDVGGEDGDCSAALTVTTKLQVTVTVTAESYDAEETSSTTTISSPAAESLHKQKQVVTAQAITTSTSAHRYHHHSGSSSGGRPYGTSVSGSYVSSTVKPSIAVSRSRVSSSTATSLVAVPSSSQSTQEIVLETYATSSSLAESSSLAAGSSSAPAATTSSTHAAPTTSSSSTKSSTTSSPALYTSSTVQPTTMVTSTKTSSSAPAASPGSSYSGKGKRGIAYNDASLTKGFASSSQISWAYNWASGTSGLASGLMFIPTLWGNNVASTKNWQTDAQKAIASGSTHLFSFNEPDHWEQANLKPEVAAAAYKTYLSDMFGGGKTKLCAPSITNGGGEMGLTWLKNFMAACPSCQVDCINVHWYGNSASELEAHMAEVIAVAGDKEIWLTEFALNGSPAAATVQSFLQKVMAFLDKTEQVAGYAYFMASQGRLVEGSNPSNPVGTTYMG